MPGRKFPVALGTVASIRKRRVAGSAAAAIEVTTPLNLPGTESTATAIRSDRLRLAKEESATPKTTLTELMSASVKAGCPGETRDPTSIERFMRRAAHGAIRTESVFASSAEDRAAVALLSCAVAPSIWERVELTCAAVALRWACAASKSGAVRARLS